MVYQLKETERAAKLFEGWEETLIYSCLQRVMGKIFVTNPEQPLSAYAYAGCFAFYAGEPCRELVESKPEGFVIMVPQNDAWARLIEDCWQDHKKYTRYAIKKDTIFDKARLAELTGTLPEGYTLHDIDGEIYDLCLKKPFSTDFVSVFGSKESYLEKGLGVVALKDGEIVSGASSYTRYNEGIELEVGTKEQERRKGLAAACCAALILRCLERGLYPSWDAHNMNSVRLAQKLGYELSHEYPAYEVSYDLKAY